MSIVAPPIVCTLTSLLLVLPSVTAAQSEAPVDPGTVTWALATVDGTVIMMKGPWQIDGRRVLYTGVDGKLTSIRTDNIDWRRSRALYQKTTPQREQSRDSTRPAPAALVLTNKEVGSYEAPSDKAKDGEGIVPSQPVRVISWEPSSDPGPVSIFGTLRNEGRAAAREINVIVSLYDETHELITRRPAKLVAGSLSPGKTTNFRVFFDDVYSGEYASANFGVQSRIRISEPAAEARDDSR